jgi:hypothetical protein
MPPAGFEPVTPPSERQETFGLDGTAARIVFGYYKTWKSLGQQRNPLWNSLTIGTNHLVSYSVSQLVTLVLRFLRSV